MNALIFHPGPALGPAQRAPGRARGHGQPQFYLDGPAAQGPERMEVGAAQWMPVPYSTSSQVSARWRVRFPTGGTRICVNTTEKIQIMQRYDFRSRTMNDTTEDIKKPERIKQSNRGKQSNKQRKTHDVRRKQGGTVPKQSVGVTTNTAERHTEVIKLENGTGSIDANVFQTRLTEKDESSPQQASNFNILI